MVIRSFMLFDIFAISLFFFIVSVGLILLRDSCSVNKVHLLWCFGVGLLVLPIF